MFFALKKGDHFIDLEYDVDCKERDPEYRVTDIDVGIEQIMNLGFLFSSRRVTKP